MPGINLLLVCATLCAFLCLAESGKKKCEYEKYSKEHTFCKPPNKQCKMMEKGVSAEGKKILLDDHNKYRQRVSNGEETEAGGLPKGSNMREMIWDDELAKIAQAFAEQCAFKHDCYDCRKVERFDVGQNLFLGYDPKDYESVVPAWYKEVSKFDKSKVNPYKYAEPYGHFSQVVWAESVYMGCGRSVYKGDDGTKVLIACNYGPPANYDDEAMYQEGDPCSACPDDTKCSSTYSALCSAN